MKSFALVLAALLIAAAFGAALYALHTESLESRSYEAIVAQWVLVWIAGARVGIWIAQLVWKAVYGNDE